MQRDIETGGEDARGSGDADCGSGARTAEPAAQQLPPGVPSAPASSWPRHRLSRYAVLPMLTSRKLFARRPGLGKAGIGFGGMELL